MILADTSIWVDHFRSGDNRLKELLDKGQVLVHPFIVGELACGNLKNREHVLSLLSRLPCCVRAEDDEVLEFIGKRALFGRGIGYIDAHLLASTVLTPDAFLWTADKGLLKIAEEMGVGER